MKDAPGAGLPRTAAGIESHADRIVETVQAQDPQGPFTLTDLWPGLDAHRSSRERRVLGTLVSRPHRSAAVLLSHLREGHPRPQDAPFPGPSPP